MNGYIDEAFRSDSVDASEEHLTANYGRVAISRSFTHYGERMVGDPRFLITTGHLLGVGDVAGSMDLVVVAAASGVHWESGGENGDLSTRPAVFLPQQAYTASLVDARFRSVGLQAEQLRRTARLLYAQDDLEVRFDGMHPGTVSSGAHWLAALGVARGLLEDGLLANDVLRASTFRLLAVASLESFRLIGDRRALRGSAERRRRVYRSGAEFLDAFASLPVTIDDAAEAAGSSVPELLLAFRAHAPRAATPTAYLRRARLDGAMRDLRGGDQLPGDTVRRVALRWGFPSPSRFAAQFRSAFGVDPARLLLAR